MIAYGLGKNLEKVCEMCHITVNKIAIFDENGTLIPGGVRIGGCIWRKWANSLALKIVFGKQEFTVYSIEFMIIDGVLSVEISKFSAKRYLDIIKATCIKGGSHCEATFLAHELILYPHFFYIIISYLSDQNWQNTNIPCSSHSPTPKHPTPNPTLQWLLCSRSCSRPRALYAGLPKTLQKLLHRFHWIVPGYIMGSENSSKEKARLRKGISILVATPSSLLDHLKHKESFVHTNLRSIIFDEADRILELGFGKEIEEIIDILGSRHNSSAFVRQNVLLSATLNDKVNHLANISLDKPVMIGLDDNKTIKPSSKQVTSLESAIQKLENSGKVAVTTYGEYKLPAQLNQRYVKVPCGSRLAVLLSVLKNLFTGEASQKVVVINKYLKPVDKQAEMILQMQLKADYARHERTSFTR